MASSSSGSSTEVRGRTAQLEGSIEESPALEKLPGIGYQRGPGMDSTFDYCSSKISNILDFTAEELTSTPKREFYEMIHPDDRERVQRTIQRCSKRNENFYVEYRLLNRDKESVWVSDRGQCYQTENGDKIVGFIEPIKEGAFTENQHHENSISTSGKSKFDYLTDLSKRHWFLEKVDGDLENYEQNDYPVDFNYTLALLDLDDFQQINDFFGREVGDKIIRRVADLLKKKFGDDAILGRVSGDRFGIFCHIPEEQDTKEYFEDQLESFSRTYSIDDAEITQEFTLGISEFPKHADDLQTLVTTANRALDRAKEYVNKSLALFEESDLKTLESQLTAKEKVLEAINEDRISLHYQPIIDHETGDIFFQEALVRIEGSDGKLHSIKEFKEVIYEGKITRKLDRKIIKKCFQELQDVIGTDVFPRIGLNLFPPSVVDPTCMEDIDKLTQEYDFPKEKLIIEIPETLMLSHRDQATTNIIDGYKNFDFQFALDDFGVGHGSFKTLDAIPIDYLKIDGSFVQNLPANNVEQKFVEMTSGLCNQMDLTVIGEWIETKETAELLRELGVTYQQGYYYDSPRGLDDWKDKNDLT